MRSDSLPAPEAKSRQPLKLLLWTAVLSLLFGAIGFGEPLEDLMRMGRNSLHPQKASGDIVLVTIDDRSLREIGEWPWPRATQAELVENATALGAKRIFIDVTYDAPTTAENDKRLAQAFAKSGKVVLPVRAATTANDEVTGIDGAPLPMFTRHTALAHIGVTYNYQHAVWKLPYMATVPGKQVPSFAAGMANGKGAGDFRLDYSIQADTVPKIPASDLLKGRIEAARLAGKTVVIASFSDQIGDQYWIPGMGRMPGALVQIIGAETLKTGQPIDLGWRGALLLTLGVLVASLRANNHRSRSVILGVAGLALLIAPLALEYRLVFVDVVPAMFALAILSGGLALKKWKRKGLTNSTTDLPNLEALRLLKVESDNLLVAARVHNYAQIASTLTAESERKLVRQIADRLRVADRVGHVFQGDEGVFAWFGDANTPVGNHLEALHSLFRSPVGTNDHPVDVAITFGVEAGASRSLNNRLGSALMAADEAWSEGLKWKFHDPARQEEVSWRLSLLGELDAAIDNGEVWLAFQPQIDLRTGKVTGAEALARWTHPIKGPISPAEFVSVAEANGRIGKLTDFVLDRAISSAATINRRGAPFTVAVNLSARLLSDRELIERIVRLLDRYGLDPRCLTLELTETAALNGSGEGLVILDALRSHGIRIAIDDYGTGLSTLEYLKKIPANEIKIDQSFIKAMRVTRSDQLMVQSTIALAHSLGRTVVAEGVEDRDCLQELRDMDCDVAQGFAVGRPMGIRELVQRLQISKIRRVA